MKTHLLALILIICNIQIFAQKKLPELNLLDLKNSKHEIKKIVQNDGPVAISFWATWCKPCLNELNAINENIEEMREDFNFKMIAVSIDDSRSINKIKSTIRTYDWDFDVYIDINQKLKRALAINSIPHLILLNNKGEIIWEHSSYSPGSEEELFEKVKEARKNQQKKK
ncbi:MAG: TlpA family protein disulfide reductase [Marinifilaceae bacterium]|jgi:thiol-disulfide isomerase/thioredoxin|nr:TlpA family protein disulfide reductase [Marinifilaceae bacterium]